LPGRVAFGHGLEHQYAKRPRGQRRWGARGAGRAAGGPQGGLPAGLEGLAAAIGEFAADDLDQLGDALLAAQVVAVQRLGDQLDADWLRRLAAVDARGAAGAEVGASAPSTQGWLRATTRMSPAAAGQRVRTARALHQGPLVATAAALAAGEISYQHAAVLADATHDLPPAKVAEAEGVLVDAARRLDPARLHRLAGHLRDVLDPQGSEERGRARLERRGLWLAATFDGMVAVNGLLDPDAGEAARAALAPLARPTGPDDERSAAQRRADALGELARQALQAGHLPDCGGLRPQLAVTVEFASLLAEQGGVVGWAAGAGSWAARPPAGLPATRPSPARSSTATPTTPSTPSTPPPTAASATAPRTVAGWPGRCAPRSRCCRRRWPRPSQLLDLGRATRVVPPALRRALAVRDGGCAAVGCDRPHPGPTPTTCTIGSRAGRPASTTWCCCAASTTAPSTKAAGNSTTTPPAARPPSPHPPAAPSTSGPHPPRRAATSHRVTAATSSPPIPGIQPAGTPALARNRRGGSAARPGGRPTTGAGTRRWSAWSCRLSPCRSPTVSWRVIPCSCAAWRSFGSGACGWCSILTAIPANPNPGPASRGLFPWRRRKPSWPSWSGS